MNNKNTRSEHVQTVLEHEIFSGVLLPGSRLDEMELAKRLNVSRTPIREALRHLAAAGLVEIHSRQPATVIRLSSHKLIEMFQVMAELEGLCAKLAARRINTTQLDNLKRIQNDLIELACTDDIEQFYEVNRQFHEAIYDASQNVFLLEQTRALRNRIGSYRRIVTQRTNSRSDTIKEHDAILQCIINGDAEGAGKAMQAHVNILGEKLLDFIALFPKEN